MRNRSYVVSIFAASVLLVACGSSSDTATSTTAATSSSAAASSSSSPATPSKASTSSSASSSTASSSVPAGSAVATAEVDAQTAAWFDTFCTGVAAFGTLGSGAAPTSPQELGDQLTTIGTTFTDTAAKLAALPPPTFEGGELVAQQLVTNMQTGGPVFTEFGQKAALLDPNDQAAGKQFQADFQAAVASLGIANFEPTPAAKAAVRAVPSCQVLGS